MSREDKIKRIQRILQVDEDPKKVLLDLIDKTDEELARISEELESTRDFVEDAVAMKIDGEDGEIGPQGEKGERGEKGEKGEQGPVGPQGPKGDKGEDGRDGRDGVDGQDGKDGADGDIGPMPKHEWESTKLRFEKEPGKWGDFVDLQGPRGSDADRHHIGVRDSSGFVTTSAQTLDFSTGTQVTQSGADTVVTVTGAGVDHGLLTGLSDDDHTQYALLDGRAAGQTLNGGSTGSGNDLRLQSNPENDGDVYLGESIRVQPNSTFADSNGIQTWENGSLLREQEQSGGGATDRFFFQPFGDRMEILNLAGTQLLFSANGDDSAIPNGLYAVDGYRAGLYEDATQDDGGAMFSGDVFIGVSGITDPPEALLHTRQSVSGNAFVLEALHNNSSTVRTVGLFRATRSGAAASDGFGPQFLFQIKDSGGTSIAGRIRVLRDGGNTQGKFEFVTGTTVWLTAEPDKTATFHGSVVFEEGQTVNRTAVGAGNYTTVQSDYIVAKTAITAGGDTITLESDTVAAGKVVIIKDESGGAAADNITIATEGAETIDGSATVTLSNNYDSITLYSDGTDWFII